MSDVTDGLTRKRAITQGIFCGTSHKDRNILYFRYSYGDNNEDDVDDADDDDDD